MPSSAFPGKRFFRYGVSPSSFKRTFTLTFNLNAVGDFDMDIFNRPPAIAEDTLQYMLYPPQDAADKASVSTFATVIHALIDELLPNFIWHRDAFQLKVAPNPDAERESGQDESYMLEGRMRVGDCVDDEWCVVWLLRAISARWDIAIRYAFWALVLAYF
jgi:hypothetical protein